MAYKGDERKKLQDGFEMADVQNDEVDLEMMDEDSVQDDVGTGFQDTKEAGETQNYDVVIGECEGIVSYKHIGKDEDIVMDDGTVMGEGIGKDEDIVMDDGTGMDGGIGMDERVSLDKILNQADFEKNTDEVTEEGTQD